MWLQLGSDSDIEPSLQQSDPSYWGLIMMQLCSIEKLLTLLRLKPSLGQIKAEEINCCC